jgi:hypothetical protein
VKMEDERLVSGGEGLEAVKLCASAGEGFNGASLQLFREGHGVSLRSMSRVDVTES